MSTIDYALVSQLAARQPARFQETAVACLLREWTNAYEQTSPDADVVTMSDGNVTFLFDMGSDDISRPAARTIAAFGSVEKPLLSRDLVYQAGFPTKKVGSSTLDRGHMMPYTGGGQFGPNIFLQDRALNRGWSAQGRRYRALETTATTIPHAMLFCHLIYQDNTDVPARIELGYVSTSELVVDAFINRTDTFIKDFFNDDAKSVAKLPAVLDTLTKSQFGDIGEETARAYLEDVDATIVSLGDSGLPRDSSRQDLDIVALLDDELIAFEIKTTFFSKNAGRLTKKGDLYRPRLGRAKVRGDSQPSFDQGSFAYTKQRLQETIAVDGMIESRVIAVDFKAFKIQQFLLNSKGRIIHPCSPVTDCADFALHGMSEIFKHRGYL
ncbi:hypothetical protein [Glutamicibacter uratoxydans]|uniref:hypothetical protein n=1 Tax=Glutamicibacter uratoxydans TaxID=43667 RepID=UPI003D6E608C